MLRAGGLLDVLTPLSDCRQEPVEKMKRIISGVSYMCWIDFHNGILGCGFLCARLISFLFRRLSISRLPRQGLPPPILTTTGYHACVFIPVITPELSRSTIPRTSGYHTRHGSSYFIVYLSPAFTPPLLLLLTPPPGATRYNLLPHAL